MAESIYMKNEWKIARQPKTKKHGGTWRGCWLQQPAYPLASQVASEQPLAHRVVGNAQCLRDGSIHPPWHRRRGTSQSGESRIHTRGLHGGRVQIRGRAIVY